jgi:dUTP pyrophosphatase
MTKILIKKLFKKIVLPKYETDGSSGMDLAACINETIIIQPNNKAIIPTGISLAIPKGFEIQIRPRSGLAAKNSLTVLNTPGTIDSDFRGEIKVILINFGIMEFKVEDKLRIAQMVLCPVIKAKFEEVDDLNMTARGEGGFGSTGTK